MNWIPLNDMAVLNNISISSYNKPQLIFKHSTRCSVSTTVKNRLDRNTTNETIDCHYLDLIAHRTISNQIAEDYQVAHESPQVILVKNGICIYDASHLDIQWDEIEEQVL
jgi:bacillithiol system protein YtxJ